MLIILQNLSYTPTQDVQCGQKVGGHVEFLENWWVNLEIMKNFEDSEVNEGVRCSEVTTSYSMLPLSFNDGMHSSWHWLHMFLKKQDVQWGPNIWDHADNLQYCYANLEIMKKFDSDSKWQCQKLAWTP